MRVLRIVLGAGGVVLVLVGLWHLLLRGRLDAPDLVSAALWLAGGVVVHDAVLAPLVVLLGVGLLPRLPAHVRAPAVAGLVVLGSVTLLAIPVLGRFGAKPDDPGLLPRPYLLWWLVLVVLVVAAVAVASFVRRPRPGVS